MAEVTITLRDTEQGVAIHSSYQPAIGAPLSPAQAHSLEIISRTRKLWNLSPAATAQAGRLEPLRVTPDESKALQKAIAGPDAYRPAYGARGEGRP